MTPAFIYFDLGNVLLKFDHSRAARQMAAVADINAERVWEVVFTGDLLFRVETGQVSNREFYEIFCEQTGTRADYESLQQAGNDIFELNRPMVPIIAALASTGRRLGILSNTSASHWEFVTDGRYALLKVGFERAVLSYEVGVMKPDLAIYRAAAEQAGVAPEEIFFTDDREENVAGAIEAGFDAVLFTGARQLVDVLRERGVRFNY
jgi:putative hydrolase of the HAD superfamily